MPCLKLGMRGCLGVALLACLFATTPVVASQRALQQTTQPPEPTYFFPLTDNTLVSTIPPSEYQVIPSQGIQWISDPAFGAVMQCDRTRTDFITLPGVTYGQTGPFAISFWAKSKLSQGQGMEYVYGHASAADRDLGADPNVIHAYFPQLDHPDHGILRAIVRDSQDGAVANGALPTYLDSDGCVANGGCPTSATRGTRISPADGDWHHIALTTQPSGGLKGLQMYVDGTFVGEMRSGETYTDENGDTHQATGGAPITLDGTLYLCSRSDKDPARFFSGSLANLRIFNSALQAEQVKAMYDADAQAAYAKAAPQGAQGVGVAAPPGSMSPQIESAQDCATPCGYYNSVFMCTSTDGKLILCGPSAAQNATTTTTPASPPLSSPAGAALSIPAVRINGQPACSPQPVESVPTVQTCGEGYLCFPLSQTQLESALGGEMVVAAVAGNVGVCMYAPDGLLLPATSQVPAPLAFFPLSSPSLESFPLGEYKSISDGASISTDPLFGGSLRCTAADADIVALDAVPYGATNGSFSLNIWVKPGKDFTGDAPLYLYSHKAIDPATSAESNTGWGRNQVQIYFPQEEHPAYGLARAYVRDGNDVYTGEESQGYIDSDGQIGNNSGPRAVRFPLLDGNWHMLTLTSEQQGGPGYRMYVDGQLAADLNARTIASSQSPELHVDGGDPMNLTGSIVLCSRSDDPSDRHLDGNLAYLSLYDEALQGEQIAALYAAVQEKNSTVTATAAPAKETPALSTKRPETQRYSISGRPCMFPALYNGEMITNCVDQGVDSFCPVAENEWEACAPLPGQTSPPAEQFKQSAEGEMSLESSDYGDSSSSWMLVPGAEESRAGDNTARGTLYSADGRRCQLPLTYRSIRLDNCVSFAGGQYCWVEKETSATTFGNIPSSSMTGEWAECAEDALLSAPQPGTLGVGPSTVPVVQMQQPVRFTTDGEVCIFPAVHAGVVYDDCAVLPEDGTSSVPGPSCLVASGEWKECSLSGLSSEEDDSITTGNKNSVAALFVAERKSVNGVRCVFPAVSKDYLWFDCADIGDAAWSAGGVDVGGGTSAGRRQICATANSTWELCAPAESSAFQTKALNLAEDLDARSLPGQLGQPCFVNASEDSSSKNVEKCTEGLTCVPLPRLVNDTTPSASPLQGAGFCAERPAGTTFGVFPALNKAKAPQPIAFFPLTDGNLEALTLPHYEGAGLGNPDIIWSNDTMFNSVPVCNKTAANAIQLANVPYGARGPFTVNLWMRRIPGNSSTEGTTFQYLFSHSAWSATPGYSPNQVAIYVPDAGHPAYGTLRAMVKDSNDNSWDMTYLDSDGSIESNAERAAGAAGHDDVNNGAWHMITLGTLPEGGDGYVLYIDGSEAGQIKSTTTLPDGTTVVTTGGDPALMGNDIFVCARSDLAIAGQEEARYYDGAVAHVMLFDAALTPDQIKDLYDTYDPSKYEDASAMIEATAAAEYVAAKDAGMETSSFTGDGGDNSESSAGFVAGVVIAVMGGIIALAAVTALAVGEIRRRRRGGGPGFVSGGANAARFERFQESSGFDSGIYPRSPRTPDYSIFAAPGNGNGAPTSDATLNIQLSSGPSGKLQGVPSGVLMKEGSVPVTPAEPAVSAGGLQHLHHQPGSGSRGFSSFTSNGGRNNTSGGFTKVSAVSPGAGASAPGNPFGGGAVTINSVPASPSGSSMKGGGSSSLGGSPGSVSGRSGGGGGATGGSPLSTWAPSSPLGSVKSDDVGSTQGGGNTKYPRVPVTGSSPLQP